MLSSQASATRPWLQSQGVAMQAHISLGSVRASATAVPVRSAPPGWQAEPARGKDATMEEKRAGAAPADAASADPGQDAEFAVLVEAVYPALGRHCGEPDVSLAAIAAEAMAEKGYRFGAVPTLVYAAMHMKLQRVVDQICARAEIRVRPNQAREVPYDEAKMRQMLKDAAPPCRAA